jgi:peptidyl-prolyl cis-trans isomerase C
MNATKTLKLAVSVASILTTLTAAAQQAPAASAAAPVSLTMKINGQASSADRGELLLREQLARGVADTPQVRNAIRETLINQAIMAQEAVKQSLDKQAIVKARMELAQELTLAQAWQQKAMQDAQVSDAEVQAEYQAQVKALGTQEFQLRHVLVADEKTAQQVLSKIKGGAKFEAVALESSRDPGTRDKGGLSDWVPEARLSPAILQAVQGLKNGQLAAQPVQTPAGWQVLKLEDKRALTPPKLEAVAPQLKSALAQKQVQAKLAAMRAAAKVE